MRLVLEKISSNQHVSWTLQPDDGVKTKSEWLIKGNKLDAEDSVENSMDCLTTLLPLPVWVSRYFDITPPNTVIQLVLHLFRNNCPTLSFIMIAVAQVFPSKTKPWLTICSYRAVGVLLRSDSALSPVWDEGSWSVVDHITAQLSHWLIFCYGAGPLLVSGSIF